MTSGREIIKRGIFGLSLLLVSPLVLLSRLERLLGNRDLFYVPCTQLVALIPGLAGVYLRAGFYFGTLERFAWNAHVGFCSILVNYPARIENNVSIGSFCVLGHVDIGPRVQIASRVSIPSGKRQHLDDEGRITPEVRFETVRIGASSWIGEGAIVLADIGDNCIVSAGAVVPNSVTDNSIVAGNPARTVGSVPGAAISGAAQRKVGNE